MLYDPRNPLSPYFAQPSGPGRGGLYFDPALVEDLPQFQDTHPRAINDGFMRILIDRMTKAFGGGSLPGLSAPAGAGRISERDIEAYRRGEVPSQPQMGADRSSGSTPPVLPPIGESQDGLMGGMSGRSTPTNQNRNFEKPIPAQSMGATQRDPQMEQQYPNASMAGPSRTPNTTPPVNQQAMFPIRGQEPRNRSPLPEEGVYRQGDGRHEQRPFAQENHSGYGSPQPSYGTASPQLSRQGEQHSARSSPKVQAGMLRPGSASGSDVNRGHSPYLSEGGRDSSRLDASSRASNAASSNTREQEAEMLAQAEEGGATDLSYYNSRKVRSADTASLRDRQSPEASSRAPSALSSTAAVPHMPGQYIPTPELNKSQQLHAPPPLFTPNNATASSMASPDLPPPPPPPAARASATDNQTHQRGQVSEQTLKEGDSSDTNDNSFGSGIAGTSTMAAMGSLDSSENQSERGLGDGRDRGASQGNSHKDSETALFDEPGALYAMSLADDHGDMSRDASAGSGHTQQPSLSKLILNRAAASGGVANGSVPSERSDSLASTANRTVGGRDAASRQNTYGSSAPISAAPTSASEYSQTGTMAESLSRSGAPSRSASQHLQSNQPSNLSKQISNTSSHHSSQNGGLPQPRDKAPAPTHEIRESKASTVSTIPSEGQDDYLAALSYVALTETHEPQHNSSPPQPTKNGKPVISIKTDPAQKTTTNGAKARQPYSSTDTEPTSASSPMYDDPTSPDSYGTYADTAAPKMRVTNASPDKQARNMARQSSSDRSHQTSTTSHATGPRKPGRGVPRVQKSGKKLGTWSSDEDDDDNDDKDSVDEEEEAERKKAEEEQRKAAEAAAIAEAERFKQERPREERPNHLRESTASSGGGSLRRSLPGLPGPSTDPYLNRATSPSRGMYPGQEDRSPYSQEMHYQQQYASNEANRGSMYSWQSQLPMPMSGGSMMSPPWQAQHQHRMSAGGSGSPYNSHSPYGHSPSPSAYGGGPAGINNQNTMLAYMPDNPETAAADGKAMRNAAVAQHGLLQTGIEQKQNKSAAQIEAMAKETGGPLLQLEHKAQMPQGGLVGAIASHERDRKRDGGLGATLTERDRERRMAEARQREMDQMAQRQAPFAGPGFGMQGFPAFGGMMPGMVPAPYGNTSDPAQMQQRKLKRILQAEIQSIS